MFEHESLLQWLDRGWDGRTAPLQPDESERLWYRGAMLAWLDANYKKYQAQQKKRVKGQGELFT